MSFINRDLQATFQIVSLLEKAEARSDEILNGLPGILLVVDSGGRVLRGNLGAADAFGTGHELLLGRRLSELFLTETWEIFEMRLRKLSTGLPSGGGLEFELALNGERGQEKPYLWSLNRFWATGAGTLELFTVIGRDVSELRKAERELLELFSSMPIGLLFVSKDGKVEGKHSAQTEALLGVADIGGATIRDLLFAPEWEQFAPPERSAIEQLPSTIGESAVVFESVHDGLPGQIRYRRPDGGEDDERYLGIQYQPIVHGGKVGRVLLLLEDRTALVKDRLREEQAKILGEKHVARVIQIKRCPEHVLPLIVKELDALVPKGVELVSKRMTDELYITLHSIKGNARIGGFEFLKNGIHEVESLIPKGGTVSDGIDWQKVEEGILEARREWEELRSLYQALVLKEGPARTETPRDVPARGRPGIQLSEVADLFQRYNALQSKKYSFEESIQAERLNLALQALDSEPASALEPLVRSCAEETAKELGKKVEVVFDWRDTRVNPATKTALNECLLHLVSNAVSHGIEIQEGRKAKGKLPTGRILVRAGEGAEALECAVEDDGGGVDVDKVRILGIRNKWIPLAEAMTMGRQELMQLIFRPGLSTADAVTDVSGRGVGLSGVAESIKKQGGEIRAEDGDPCGTRFRFRLKAAPPVALERSLVPADQFVARLLGVLRWMESHDGIAIDLDPKCARCPDSRLLIVDEKRLIVAITTFLGRFGGGAKAALEFEWDEANRVKLRAHRAPDPKGGEPACLRPEFELSIAACRRYLSVHGGSIETEPGGMTLSFGHCIGTRQIPGLFLGREDGLLATSVNEMVRRIQTSALEFGFQVQGSWERSGTPSEAVPGLVICRDGGAVQGVPSVPVGAPDDLIRERLLHAVEGLLGIRETEWRKS